MKVRQDQFEDYLRNKNLKEKTIEIYMYYFGKFFIYDKFNQEALAKFLASKSNRTVVLRSKCFFYFF